MTWPGSGRRSAIGWPSGQFVIVAGGLCRDFHGVQRRDLLLGQLRYVHRAPIQAPKALILLGRQQHHVVAPVTRHDHRLSVGNASETAELSLSNPRPTPSICWIFRCLIIPLLGRWLSLRNELRNAGHQFSCFHGLCDMPPKTGSDCQSAVGGLCKGGERDRRKHPTPPSR